LQAVRKERVELLIELFGGDLRTCLGITAPPTCCLCSCPLVCSNTWRLHSW